jgi:hypothetical protein
MKNYTRIPDLAHEATARDAIRWVRNLVRFIGPGFHPDSAFEDYVMDDGTLCFTPDQCVILERALAQAWKLLDEAGLEIYRIALTVQRRMLLASVQ